MESGSPLRCLLVTLVLPPHTQGVVPREKQGLEEKLGVDKAGEGRRRLLETLTLSLFSFLGRPFPLLVSLPTFLYFAF